MIHLQNLFPSCAINDKKIMYYVTHIEHAIKEVDLKNLEVRYLDNPENYDPTEWEGIDKIISNNNNLYLFEQNGKRILEYSLSKKTSRCFNLECDRYNCNNWCMCTVYNDMIFIFPSFINKVIKVNLISGGIEEKEELCPKINYKFNQEKDRFSPGGIIIEMPHRLYSCGCKIGNDIWIFTERKGLVLKYELKKEKCIQYLLPINIKGCIHAIWKNGVFYILGTEGSVYSWNHINDKTKIIFDSKEKYQYPYFGKIAVTDNNIWMLPAFGDEIFIVNLKSGENTIYSSYPKDYKYYEDPNMCKFYDYSEDENNYYFAMQCANYILAIEKKNGKEKWLRPIEPDLRNKIKYYKGLNIQQYEETEFGIKGYLLLLQERKSSSDAITKRKNGENMWTILK